MRCESDTKHQNTTNGNPRSADFEALVDLQSMRDETESHLLFVQILRSTCWVYLDLKTRQLLQDLGRGWEVDARLMIFGLGTHGSGFRVQGSGFRVQGSGCRVQSSGCWLLGVECRV